jgi:hypothetical protein
VLFEGKTSCLAVPRRRVHRFGASKSAPDESVENPDSFLPYEYEQEVSPYHACGLKMKGNFH